MSQYNIHSGQIEKTNPLHKFASYNALFTLSGCDEEMLRNPTLLFNRPLQNVIARSSGIGPDVVNGSARTSQQDKIINETFSGRGRVAEVFEDTNADFAESISILNRNHDIFFEDVNILSTAGPNNERNLANFTKMEFKIHEPYSITFIEKIRACAYINGYRDYQAAPLLLTIQWVGINENGREMSAGDSLTRKVPIMIARVDFDVNEGGAIYDIVATPYHQMAHDDIYKFPRAVIDVNTNSLQGFIDTTEKGLLDMQTKEVEDQLRVFKDNYFFRVHPDFGVNFLNQKFDNDEGVHQSTTVDDALSTESLDDVGTTSTSEDREELNARSRDGRIDGEVSVIKAFEDILRTHPKFKDIVDNFWRTYLSQIGYTLNEDEIIANRQILDIFEDQSKLDELAQRIIDNQFIDYFMIKTQVENRLEVGLDPITKMYPKNIYYNVIPYKIHVLKLIGAGLSLGKVDWSKLARRNYNYIYTGDNVDIQNLRINYRTAYYMRGLRSKADTISQEGLVSALRKAGNKVLGKEIYPDPVFELRQYPSNVKGRSVMGGITPTAKSQEFFDYITNPTADMVSIDLEILGDPAYVAQDQFSPSDLTNTISTVMGSTTVAGDENRDYNTKFDCFNMDSYMPIIHLKYRMPSDIQENKGVMFEGDKLGENLFFSGLYQVARVESRFESGQFTQNLRLVRFNNQKGVAGVQTNIDTRLTSLEEKVKVQNKDFEKIIEGPYRGIDDYL